MFLTDLDRPGGLDQLAPLEAGADEAGGAQHAELARMRSGGAAPAVEEASFDAEYDGAYVCRVSGGVRFTTLDEYRAHCRSDWYRYNLKRRTKSQPPVSEEQFDALVDGGADLDEISGSDESDDDDSAEVDGRAEAKTPMVTFRHRSSGMLVSVWRCVLAPGPPLAADTQPRGAEDALAALGQSVRQMASGAHWVVLLSRGGHFAAVVVRLVPLKKPPAPEAAGQLPTKAGGQLLVVAHKSLHRYVTRRKAGGRQATADGAKSIKSVGSSLRRHNEAMLTQEIRECLAAWSAEYVRTAALIFFQAPGPANAAALFGGGIEAPLSRTDPRVRSIPFITNRPTLSEATRAAQRLAYVDVHAPAPAAEAPPVPRVRPAKAATAGSGSGSGSGAAAATAEAPAQAEEPLPPSDLHEAARANDEVRVAALLAAGFDPTVRHPLFMHKVAYDLTDSREVRNAFRRRMAEAPEQWDWKAAKVTSALTAELEAAQAEKERARERERKKRREKAKREAKAAQQQQAVELAGALERACAGTDADAIEALVARAKELAVDVEAAQARVAVLRREQEAFADPQARRRREAEARAAALEKRLGLAGAGSGTAAGGSAAAGGGAGGAADAAAARCDWCGKPLPAQPFSRLVFRYCSTACVQAHSKTL